MMPLAQPRPPQAPTPPGPGVLPQVPVVGGPGQQLVPIELLQSREAQLLEQVSILRQQRSIFVRQLRSRDPQMRTAAPQLLSNVDAQLATAQTELSTLQAQIAIRQPRRDARPGQTGAFPGGGNRPVITGDMVTGIAITFTLAVLMPIAIGISRRLWRRAPAGSVAADTIAPRLERLEHAVDAIAIEIERISEGQRFVTKVMTERPIQARQAAASPAEANDASSLGEAKPFLALGAGPVEPIRVADRQKVRQSNTPH